MIYILILIIPLLCAKAAHAKGGGSTQTVDATGPKSANLQALEDSFYAAVNPILSAYAGIPAAPAAASAPAAGGDAVHGCAVRHGQSGQ
jgi:hypothetical protein